LSAFALSRRAAGIAFAGAAGALVAGRARAEPSLVLEDLRWTGTKPTFPLFRGVASGAFRGEVDVRVATRSDPVRYRPFLAFYRLATALGSRVVPRTEAHAVSLGALLAALRKDPVGLALLRDEMAVLNDGTVTVLVSETAPRGHEVDFFTSGESKSWRVWAEGSKTVPRDRRTLVTTYIETLVLDYLAANATRSTVVVDADAAAASIHLLENGGAFAERPDVGVLDAVLAQMKRMSRFPRRLVANLRAFERPEAELALHGGPFVDWLVSSRPLADMLERRGVVLSLVDARAAELGEPAVLALP
jgi:hypothetical protein